MLDYRTPIICRVWAGCQMRADIDWSAGSCSKGLAWYVKWLDDYYHEITVIGDSSVSWGFDKIWIRPRLRNLTPPLFLIICLKEKKGTEWSARTLIWAGISGAQSPLASWMGVHHTVRLRGKSRKDCCHPFLSQSPLFSISSSPKSPAWSFSLPLHPSTQPSQRHYVLT